jgi:hypothetical protein
VSIATTSISPPAESEAVETAALPFGPLEYYVNIVQRRSLVVGRLGETLDSYCLGAIVQQGLGYECGRVESEQGLCLLLAYSHSRHRDSGVENTFLKLERCI